MDTPRAEPGKPWAPPMFITIRKESRVVVGLAEMPQPVPPGCIEICVPDKSLVEMDAAWRSTGCPSLSGCTWTESGFLWTEDVFSLRASAGGRSVASGAVIDLDIANTLDFCIEKVNVRSGQVVPDDAEILISTSRGRLTDAAGKGCRSVRMTEGRAHFRLHPVAESVDAIVGARAPFDSFRCVVRFV